MEAWQTSFRRNRLAVEGRQDELIGLISASTPVAETCNLDDKSGKALVADQAIGEKIGRALVAVNADPDCGPAMRQVAAIVTEQGGRAARTAIVSHGPGLPCI